MWADSGFSIHWIALLVLSSVSVFLWCLYLFCLTFLTPTPLPWNVQTHRGWILTDVTPTYGLPHALFLINWPSCTHTPVFAPSFLIDMRQGRIKIHTSDWLLMTTAYPDFGLQIMPIWAKWNPVTLEYLHHGIKLRSWCWQGVCFPDWAISPAPKALSLFCFANDFN